MDAPITLNNTVGYAVVCRDGPVGRVRGYLIDDREWILKELVISNGFFLPAQTSAATPHAIIAINNRLETISLNATAQEIRKARPIRQPLSATSAHRRQRRLIPWDYLWAPDGWAGSTTPELSDRIVHDHAPPTHDRVVDTQFRSTSEISGNVIVGIDGEAGQVEDFFVQPTTWKIESLVVRLKDGNLYLLPSTWITVANRSSKRVLVNASKKDMIQCPGFDYDDDLEPAWNAEAVC